MKPEEFEAVAKLLRSTGQAKKVARRVLVDGLKQAEARREFSKMSRASVSNTVGRFRAADKLIRAAYSLPSKDE